MAKPSWPGSSLRAAFFTFFRLFSPLLTNPLYSFYHIPEARWHILRASANELAFTSWLQPRSFFFQSDLGILSLALPLSCSFLVTPFSVPTAEAYQRLEYIIKLIIVSHQPTRKIAAKKLQKAFLGRPSLFSLVSARDWCWSPGGSPCFSVSCIPTWLLLPPLPRPASQSCRCSFLPLLAYHHLSLGLLESSALLLPAFGLSSPTASRL